MKKLFLLDAYALIYRAYYAFIRNPRYTSKGFNTSAIFGFTNTLIEVLEKEKPSHIAVVFDLPGKTFRHESYEAYKANRLAAPEDITNAVPYIKKIIGGFNIPVISVENYEADDVIGTLAFKAEKAGFDTYMMTPDKDFAQLVSEKIFMYKPRRSGKNQEILGVEEIKKLYGVDYPKQFIEILGLMGDASDNIPGCPGIGPKTAQKLIQQYKSIENIYENIDELKGKQKEALQNNKEQVFLSRELATIITDVPVGFDEESLQKEALDDAKLRPVFKELEFATLAKKVFEIGQANKTRKQPQQGSLFDNLVEPSVADEKNIPETLSGISHQYFHTDTDALRADLRADLCIQEKFAFHLLFEDENPSRNYGKDLPVGIAFSFKEHEGFFVPFPNNFFEIEKIIREFVHIFEDENILKISHHQKQNIIFLHRSGIRLKGDIFDTRLAHYLIQPELKHEDNYIAEHFLNYKMIGLDALKGSGRSKISLREMPQQRLLEIGCEKAGVYFRLETVLKKEMLERKVTDLYKTMEIPLLKTLAAMEISGVKVDTKVLGDYAEYLQKEVTSLKEEIIRFSGGGDFNVASPKQLGEVLFEKMKIDSNAKKTASGQYSTSEAVLMKLKGKHPVIAKILQYRSLSKLLSTYADALPDFIHPETGKIHTCFDQTEAATGRLSSKNPNLQNIPIRTPEGRLIRKAFVPSDANHIFLSADYSQIELRLMADMSQDPNMIRAFLNLEDIHASTAAQIFKIPLKEVTKEMRYQAKTANFGIIYGISAWGLAERLEISRSEGKKLIEGYFESYPQVKSFMDECIAKARKNIYVETIMGRRRYLKDINSRNAFVRGFAERNAINAPIQGSAADIIKMAMVNIYRRMQTESLQSKMILQVHDELNFDCIKSEQEILSKLIKEEMENAVSLRVPLVAEIGFGNNWLEAH